MMTRRAAVVLIGAVVVLSRFWALGADPPEWMPGAWLVDSGWWANGARGAVLFHDPLSEDYGMAALMVPGYTWALLPFYRAFGVDLFWGQALAAAANVLTIALVVACLWRKVGTRAALWGTALLAASPFYWAHGRAALPESLQAFFLILGFALWALGDGRPAWAFFAGAALGAGVVVKLNGVNLGLLPLLLAAALAWTLAEPPRPPLRNLVMAAAGLAAVGLVAFLLVVAPHPEVFATALRTESRTRGFPWLRHLTFPGYALISDGQVLGERNVPVLWRVARWSPAIVLALWLYLLEALRDWRWGGWAALRSRGPFEAVCAAWALLAWAAVVLGLNQWEYRYLLPLPLFAILGALRLARRDGPVHEEKPAPAAAGWLYRWLLWAVVLLPVLVVVKPVATRWLMRFSADWHVAGRIGLGTGAAGTPFVLAWAALLALLSPAAALADRVAGLAARSWARAAIAAIVLVEAGLVVHHLSTADATLRRGLAGMEAAVVPGETVAGRLAATLFHGVPVHTVRCASALDDPDVFDWSVVRDRCNPRYVVLIEDTEGVVDADYPLYRAHLTADGYRETRRLSIGPYNQRAPRYTFVLFERSNSRS